MRLCWSCCCHTWCHPRAQKTPWHASECSLLERAAAAAAVQWSMSALASTLTATAHPLQQLCVKWQPRASRSLFGPSQAGCVRQGCLVSWALALVLVACRLAQNVLKACESGVKPALQKYLTTIILSPISSNSDLHQHCYTLIYQVGAATALQAAADEGNLSA